MDCCSSRLTVLRDHRTILEEATIMDKRTSVSLIVGAILFSFSACDSGADNEMSAPDGGDLYQQIVDGLKDAFAHSCQCVIDSDQDDYGYGYDSVDECVNDAFEAPAILDCTASVWASYTDEVKEHIDCNLEALNKLLECQDSFGCNLDRLSICYDNYFEKTERDCPQIPYEVNAQVSEQCLGHEYEPPFTCADGQQIPASYECDGYSDCDDQTDEVGCPYFCYDGTELDTSVQCDGVDDCSMGEDEFGCY